MIALMLIAGLALLFIGGETLVRGATELSLKLGVPPLIVGLTVVAFGTSAPELLVVVDAALLGESGIALGNIVGSNIANVLMVLGVPALITVLVNGAPDTRRNIWFMLVATALFIALAWGGTLYWWHGLIMLGAMLVILGDAFRAALGARKARNAARAAEEIDLEGATGEMAGWKVAGLILVGLIALPIGAHYLVKGAVDAAEAFGFSREAAGLIIVALGTSLPELAASVAAALRRNTEMAFGNVIGSNLFNALFIGGIGALVAPLAVPARFYSVDFPLMALTAVALAWFVLAHKPINRVFGVILVAVYGVYALMALAPAGA